MESQRFSRLRKSKRTLAALVAGLAIVTGAVGAAVPDQTIEESAKKVHVQKEKKSDKSDSAFYFRSTWT